VLAATGWTTLPANIIAARMVAASDCARAGETLHSLAVDDAMQPHPAPTLNTLHTGVF